MSVLVLMWLVWIWLSLHLMQLLYAHVGFANDSHAVGSKDDVVEAHMGGGGLLWVHVWGLSPI